MKDKLIEVLKIQSESYNQFRVFAYIIRQLKKLGCSYYVFNGCIYVTKGTQEFFPCIVAHMDTVHDIAKDLTVIEIKGNLTGLNSHTMKQTGIGGDDKVGIFIALQVLEEFDNVKAVFFRDEEIGCEGSYTPDIKFFSDCGFVLQCDRQGYGDFITNASGVKLSGKYFQNDIKPVLDAYGYSFKNGAMTDVMALKESGIECSMANMSCGYYNPHTASEYVNIEDVMYCMNMVKEIIRITGGKRYASKYKKKAAPVNLFSSSYGKKTTGYNGWKNAHRYSGWSKENYHDAWEDFDYDGRLKKDKPKEKVEYCACCAEPAKLYYSSEYNMDLCEKCVKEHTSNFTHLLD